MATQPPPPLQPAGGCRWASPRAAGEGLFGRRHSSHLFPAPHSQRRKLLPRAGSCPCTAVAGTVHCAGFLCHSSQLQGCARETRGAKHLGSDRSTAKEFHLPAETNPDPEASSLATNSLGWLLLTPACCGHSGRAGVRFKYSWSSRSDPFIVQTRHTFIRHSINV